MLFYGDDEDLKNCRYYKLSRNKVATYGENDTIQRKILRYLKITPHLQLLYVTTRAAQHM